MPLCDAEPREYSRDGEVLALKIAPSRNMQGTPTTAASSRRDLYLSRCGSGEPVYSVYLHADWRIGGLKSTGKRVRGRVLVKSHSHLEEQQREATSAISLAFSHID